MRSRLLVCVFNFILFYLPPPPLFTSAVTWQEHELAALKDLSVPNLELTNHVRVDRVAKRGCDLLLPASWKGKNERNSQKALDICHAATQDETSTWGLGTPIGQHGWVLLCV